MRYTTERLKKLKDELYALSKDAQSGILDKNKAADKIIELRDQIDEILAHLSKSDIKNAK
jgi:hypothetical protein